MKILQLCNKPPYPPVDGGTLAMHCITEGLLAEGCQVRVLSMCSQKHPVGTLPEQYQRDTRFEAVEMDLSIHKLDAAVALLCGESYHVKRFVSKEFERRLVAILQEEQFDIIHLESIYLAPYLEAIRKHSQAKVVLRAHNVEHEIWRRVALQEPNALKRWYLKKLALALRLYEQERLPLFDAVLCITPQDAQRFRELVPNLRRPLHVLPFGVDEQPLAPAPAACTCYHLGAMDWMPNQEGVRWLAHAVWPQVRKQMPNAELHLAGRRMPQEMLQWNLPGVKVQGEVPSAEDFIADKAICLVPLFSGSGIRVKMLQAMAAGKAVVSTRIGLQGIEALPEKHLLLADSPDDFASQVVRLLKDRELVQRLGRQAHSLVHQKYAKQQLAKELTSFYQKLSQ